MKLLSVSLGNRKGEFEILGIVDVPNKSVKFQALANGLVFCESDVYDEVREVVLEALAMNENNKQRMN